MRVYEIANSASIPSTDSRSGSVGFSRIPFCHQLLLVDKLLQVLPAGLSRLSAALAHVAPGPETHQIGYVLAGFYPNARTPWVAPSPLERCGSVPHREAVEL